MVWNHVLK